jgi:hypothetical protein
MPGTIWKMSRSEDRNWVPQKKFTPRGCSSSILHVNLYRLKLLMAVLAERDERKKKEPKSEKKK